MPGAIRTIAILGNHAPRQCGIATFTTDLSESIGAEFSESDCFVLAMNDAGRHHEYPARVRFEIAESDLASYRRAADFLNVNAVDVLCVQHEYGIFGGKAGSHVLALLRELRMPIVTTLHTILGEPTPVQRGTMDEIAGAVRRARARATTTAPPATGTSSSAPAAPSTRAARSSSASPRRSAAATSIRRRTAAAPRS